MNENITLPVCAELIGGGDPGVNGPLNREAVLLITTVEGAAGILWYSCSTLAYYCKLMIKTRGYINLMTRLCIQTQD